MTLPKVIVMTVHEGCDPVALDEYMKALTASCSTIPRSARLLDFEKMNEEAKAEVMNPAQMSGINATLHKVAGA